MPMAKCSLKTSTRRSWLQGTNAKDSWSPFKKMKLPEAMEKTAHQNWKAAGVESRTSEELSPPSLLWRVRSVQSSPWIVRPPLQIGLAAVKQGPVDSKRGQCFLDSTWEDRWQKREFFYNVYWNFRTISLALWMESLHAAITNMLSICFCFMFVRFSTQPSQVRLDVLHPLAGHLHRLAIELWHVVACRNLAPWERPTERAVEGASKINGAKAKNLSRRWYEDVQCITNHPQPLKL